MEVLPEKFAGFRLKTAGFRPRTTTYFFAARQKSRQKNAPGTVHIHR
jgi:hypothetical protein